MHLQKCYDRVTNSFVNFSYDSLLADMRKRYEIIAKESRMFIFAKLCKLGPWVATAGNKNLYSLTTQLRAHLIFKMACKLQKIWWPSTDILRGRPFRASQTLAVNLTLTPSELWLCVTLLHQNVHTIFFLSAPVSFPVRSRTGQTDGQDPYCGLDKKNNLDICVYAVTFWIRKH